MRPFVEMPVSVDPWEKAGDVAEPGEGDNRLVELDLTARDELALEDSVVNLLVQGSLRLREGGCWLVPLEDHVEVS